MKKAGKRVLAMLLAAVMILSTATVAFADETAPDPNSQDAVQAEEVLAEDVPELPLNTEAQAGEEAVTEEAAELSEYLANMPLNTEAPAPYAMDNSTTLADGEYPIDAANFSFTGGTGKAKLTLNKVVVTDGKAYGHFTASSAYFTHAFIGVSNTSDDTPAIYDPATDTMAENVYKIEDKQVVMPVDLNVEVPVACRTTAMGTPHWIQYQYVITLEEPEAPAQLYHFTMQLSKAPKTVSDTHPANFIEGEWIHITDASGIEYAGSRISDTGSMYSFTGLPAGTYTITAGVPGYVPCNDASLDVWDTAQHGYVFTPTGAEYWTKELVIDETKEDQGNIILTFVKAADPVDFTRVDELLAIVPSDMSLFVTDTTAPVTAAVAAIDRDETDQTVIDGWADALQTALAGLLPKDGRYEVTLKKFNGTPYYLYEGLADNDKAAGKTVLVVEDGKMTAENVYKGTSYGYCYLGTKEEAMAASTETAIAENAYTLVNAADKITVNGNEYNYTTGTVDVPALCTEIKYAYHSGNLEKYKPNVNWYDHAVIYQANSLVRLDASAEEYPINLSMTNNVGMFKLVSAVVEKEGEQLYLVIALSGSGYHELYMGTYEEAVANGDNRDNWVHGATNADGKWEFHIPITAEMSYMPCISISNSYLTKYEQGLNPLERAFYARQFELNLEEKTIVVSDYDETMTVAVTSYVDTFKVAETAGMRVVGCPNSNNFNCIPVLQMLDDRYDSVTYPTVVSGKLGTATAELSADKTFEISLLNAPNLNAFQDKEPIEMIFHVAGTEESETIPVTIDKMAKTITIGEKPAEPTALGIINNVKMFKPTAAEISADGASLVVTMGSTAFDKVYVGAANEAVNVAGIALSAENTFTFAMTAFEAAENGAVNVAFHSARQDKWYNRLLTLDTQAKTLTFDDNNANYETVDAALAAAQAVIRDDYTEDSLALLDAAVAAVVTGYPADRQADVEAMAAAITNAIASLVKKTEGELTDGTYKATKVTTDVTTDASGMIKVMEATVVIKGGQATAIVTMKGTGCDRFYTSDTATKETIVDEAWAEQQKELSGQEGGLLGGLVLEGSSAYTFWPVPITLGEPKLYACRSAKYFHQNAAPAKQYFIHDFQIDAADLEKISDSTEIMTPAQEAQRYVDQFYKDGKATANHCEVVKGTGTTVTIPYYEGETKISSFDFKRLGESDKFVLGWFVDPSIQSHVTSSCWKKIRYPDGKTVSMKAASRDAGFTATATLKLYPIGTNFNKYDSTGVYFDADPLVEETFTFVIEDKPIINFNTTVAAADVKTGEAIEGLTVCVVDESDNSEVTASDDGTYALNSLKKYTIAVSKEGYVAVGGAAEAVKSSYSPSKDETVTLQLLKEEESKQTVTFDVKDQFDEAVTNPVITVKLGDETIAPEADGSFKLYYNTRYTYTVEAEGYQAYTYGYITPKEDTVENVKLNKYLTEHKIFLDAYDAESHELLEDVDLFVSLGDEELTANEDGSYTAPDGEDVEVTCLFIKGGYKNLVLKVVSTGFDVEIHRSAWMYKTEEVQLREAIEAAEEFAESIVEGDEPLQYPEGTREALDAAIDTAFDIYCDNLSEEEYEAARLELKKAVNAAKAAQNPKIATITVRINTALNEAPQVLEDLVVTGDDAKTYRYSKSSDCLKDVTFVDVIAAVHKELYGDEFANSPRSYYDQDEFGLYVITKMFGNEIKNAAYELALNDTSVDHLGYYKKVVEDGDVVSIGVGVGKGDYLYFNSVDDKTLPGEYENYLFKNRKSSLTPEETPAEGYEVTLVKEAAEGETAEAVEVKATSDADGKVTFNFEEPGVYTVKSVTKEGVENICVPFLKVTVEAVLEVINNCDYLDVVGATLDAADGTLTIRLGETTIIQTFQGEAATIGSSAVQDIGADNSFTYPISYFAENGGAADISFLNQESYNWTNCLMTLDVEARTLKLDPDDADYSAVEEAVQKAWSIKAASYTDESVFNVYQAAGSVVYGMNKSHQPEVDAMAKAVNDALKGLVLKTATTDRFAGSNRYKTALAIAEQLKKTQGIKKFDAIVLCTGENYPDALAGGYLASLHNAPLLLIRGKAADKTNVTKYINNNLQSGGTVYVLGSTDAVPKSWISGIKSKFKVKRLAGKNRFGTDIAILKEAGLYEGMSLIVTNGYDYTDALCASSLSMPLLIANTKKNILTDEQKNYLKPFNKTLHFYVVGPSSVISDKIFNALKDYGTPVRIATDKNPVNRSVQLAEYFWPRPQTVTLATSGDFADGLSGGILVSRNIGPLLLVKSGSEAKAKAYVKKTGVRIGYVLGSTKAVSDASVKKILPNAKKIKVHDYKY